jgi:catechol 2,3-dioxygenase-like lactoylglutathione lyase family enzyme
VAITGLNHVVVYVRNATRTVRFYEDVLDFVVLKADPDGKWAFMNAPGSHNDHDIAFFSIGDRAGPSTAGGQTVGLYHLAWEVATLEDLVRLRQRLVEAGALVGEANHETHLSLYAKDPDGLEFELTWFVPADKVPAGAERTASHPLDLDAEVGRLGAHPS